METSNQQDWDNSETITSEKERTQIAVLLTHTSSLHGGITANKNFEKSLEGY